MSEVELSVVIPAYNEEANVDLVYDRLSTVLDRIGLPWELIFSLDPSTDGTEERILALRGRDPRVKLLRFSRRFGQPMATLAGLDAAGGDAVVVIDCDLQDPPELIPELVARWQEGYDVVYAQRRTREGETLAKRVVSSLGYRLIGRVAEVDIPPNTGDFRLMSRRVVDNVVSLKESHGRLVDIQTVAFPQSGVLRDPGTEDLLDAAIAAGADLVGGLDPAGIDHDIEGQLDAIFGIAEKHGVGLDIHLHDGGTLGAFELRQIAARTVAAGLDGKVAVSHAFCLGELDDRDFGAAAEALSRADVAIMTNGPGPVSMPPVKRLMAEGVRVFCGSDNIRDAWSPFGNGDMLERAAIVCDRQNFRADAELADAFGLVTTAPASVIGRPHALQVGAPADFCLLHAGSIAEAVASRSTDRIVFRGGVMLANGGRLLGAHA